MNLRSNQKREGQKGWKEKRNENIGAAGRASSLLLLLQDLKRSNKLKTNKENKKEKKRIKD